MWLEVYIIGMFFAVPWVKHVADNMPLPDWREASTFAKMFALIMVAIFWPVIFLSAIFEMIKDNDTD